MMFKMNYPFTFGNWPTPCYKYSLKNVIYASFELNKKQQLFNNFWKCLILLYVDLFFIFRIFTFNNLFRNGQMLMTSHKIQLYL